MSSPAPKSIRSHIGAAQVIPGLIALIALIAVGWAISVRGDLDDATERAEQLQAEVDQLRAASNATAYTLLPAADAPPNASGLAFFSLDGAGVISMANLSQVPDGRSYQIWFYPTPNSEPIPGQTFTVDDTGAAFLLIPADVGVFTTITVTIEPEAGTTAPTGPVILSGETGGARG